MNWKTKLAFLLLCSIPAFTGYPLNRFGALVVDGITWAWAAYLFISHFTVLVLCGRKQYARILTAAALVTLPVIGSGGCISFLASLFETDLWHAQVIYSTHYLRLCVTMLTVIPLALGLVARPGYLQHPLPASLCNHADGYSAGPGVGGHYSPAIF